MPYLQASPIHLSPRQHEILQRMAHRTKSAQRLVKRGQIILEAAEGTSNTSIARHLQADYETVRRWRDRWRSGVTFAGDRSGRKAETAEPGDRSPLDR